MIHQYEVILQYDISLQTSVTVTACSENEARSIAYDIAHNNSDIVWEPTDYCGDTEIVSISKF